LVATLWLAMSVAASATSPSVAGATAVHASSFGEEEDTREAKRLYQEGRVHYETAEYMEALESFKGAYRQAQTISSEAFRNEVLVALLFNLARAHVKACAIDGDASHLRQAEDLLETYLASDSAMVDEADADELKAEIAALEEELAGTMEGPADPEEAPTGATEPANASGSAENTDGAAGDGGRGLVIAGGVLMGLSAVGLGLMTGGIVGANRAEQDYIDAANGGEREIIDARGQRMNGLAVAGGISAGVLLSAGVALLLVGKRRQRSNLALDVSASPGYAGLGLRGRF